MSEEKHILQHKADRARSRSKRSVFTYMVILFLAAFVLLLLAYAMQQRSSVDAIDDLKDSVSAIQTAQEVYEENAALREQIDALEDQIGQLEGQIAALTQSQQEQVTGLETTIGQLTEALDRWEKAAQAMDWFWQINEAYVRGRTTQARELIEQINSAGLAEYLPTQSITANSRFSPYDRYQEIYDALY